MEWVEITARTVDEARDLALDQLGVDEQDAEVEVLEEPRPGLFGRLRGQARIRARVATDRAPAQGRARATAAPAGDRRPGGVPVTSPNRRDDGPSGTDVPADERAPTQRGGPAARRGGERRHTDRGGHRHAGAVASTSRPTPSPVSSPAWPSAFGIDGTSTTSERVEEDTIEVRLDGGDLGLLIGPKGQTLHTVQELARTVVQRRGGGTQEGRIRIDIAGYRQRRREALERFTQQVAETVLATGERRRRSSR